jgi:Tfp pilus assembly protein PilV
VGFLRHTHLHVLVHISQGSKCPYIYTFWNVNYYLLHIVGIENPCFIIDVMRFSNHFNSVTLRRVKSSTADITSQCDHLMSSDINSVFVSCETALLGWHTVVLQRIR